MKIDLSGKHALVTGASKGIGHAIGTAFCEAGAEVTMIARTSPKTLPPGARFVEADFSKPDESLEIIKKSMNEKSVNILVNNTGGPPPGPVVDASWSDFQEALQMHLRMSQGLVQLVIPSMKKDGFGRIINVISTSVKSPIQGLGVSNTVRGAMANWSKTLAFEVGPFGITVNNILPGLIETDRLASIIHTKAEKQASTIEDVAAQMKAGVPAGRFGQPSEMASLATFLASDLASYINGTNIPVDGGRTPTL